jgi:hypothetical protein
MHPTYAFHSRTVGRKLSGEQSHLTGIPAPEKSTPATRCGVVIEGSLDSIARDLRSLEASLPELQRRAGRLEVQDAAKCLASLARALQAITTNVKGMR